MSISSSPPDEELSNTNAEKPNRRPPSWLSIVLPLVGPFVNLVLFILTQFVLSH